MECYGDFVCFGIFAFCSHWVILFMGYLSDIVLLWEFFRLGCMFGDGVGGFHVFCESLQKCVTGSPL